MKFSVEKASLLHSLQHINKVIPSRSTLPILSCALFEIKNNQLLIRATNLEVYISVKIDVEDIQVGKVSIPLNTLLDITNAMPEEFLHFEISDIGKVMAIVMKKGGGKVDGGIANRIAKELLQ